MGTIEWNDGSKYQGEFTNNHMNGYGMIEFPEKNFYQGEIKNGKMDGFGEFFSPMNKTASYRYTKNHFCPFQRYVEHRPNPYRPLSKTNSYLNQFNFPIEKDKFIFSLSLL